MCLMMIRNKLLLTIYICAGVLQIARAQDLLKELEIQSQDTTQVTIATFFGTHISIGHSVETREKGALEITSMNRFWNRPISDTERTQTFVADKLNSRVGVDYSFSNRFTIGAGFTTGDKTLDIFGKYRLFYQKDGSNSFPFSMSLFQGLAHRESTNERYLLNPDQSKKNKIASTTQLLIARKISRNFSLQLSPTLVYREEESDVDGMNASNFALGLGGRYKVGNHVSFVSEYYYLPNKLDLVDTYGAFSLGVNWELSDLLLQFKLTNVRDLVEDKVYIKTTNNFNFRDGNLHFGFHATYFIQL